MLNTLKRSSQSVDIDELERIFEANLEEDFTYYNFAFIAPGADFPTKLSAHVLQIH